MLGTWQKDKIESSVPRKKISMDSIGDEVQRTSSEKEWMI